MEYMESNIFANSMHALRFERDCNSKGDFCEPVIDLYLPSHAYNVHI